MENIKSPTEYITAIEGIRQQIYMLGANDVEFSQLNVILDSFKKGEISGDEAIIKAQTILNSKQDYH